MMEKLFNTGTDLFAAMLGSTQEVNIPLYVGGNLHVGSVVEIKKPVWMFNNNTGERTIEGFKRIKGIVIKMPRNPTPRSFVHLQTEKKVEKITLATFRFGTVSLAGADSDEAEFVEVAYAMTSQPMPIKYRTKKYLVKMAADYGLTDETQIKELYEVSVMQDLKFRLTNNIQQNYHTAVEIYNNQINFNHRTSNSVMLQQYSTPLPLAYLAGAYVVYNQPKAAEYFEPSAGNGLLTVALPNNNTTVNEIDHNRRRNLEQFGNYANIINQDGSKPFKFPIEFDGIITNPPFGRWDKETIGGYPISKLEHIMAIRALDTMAKNGRAAIIIGGHTEWDEYNRVKNGANRYFLSYLHHFYNVKDIINIDGKMYAKQGTTFPIRLILINERKATTAETAPLKTDKDKTVHSFDELWDRMACYFTSENKKAAMKLLELLNSKN